jgi:poly-gamma-glutamate synthase PgsB/CapB
VDLTSLFNPADSALGVILAVLGVFLGIEIFRLRSHKKALAKIPERIHVNGSRGKSSVTRLIGAAMRATGKVTVTKTTGTAPRFIMPDGCELAIFRAGKPNIIEQLRVVKRAAGLKAEVLVMECMAVTPEYISTLEKEIIRSTLGVITNIREDHLDVMGPTMYDVTVNVARSLPANGTAYTAEKKWFRVLETEARARGTELIQAREETVSDKEMAGFSYVEHKENVAIALAVVDRYGIAREKALAAMHAARPDPGVLRETHVATVTGPMHFFNALAANDPDSSILIWNMACARRAGKRIAVLILRSDRIQRTEGFARVLGSLLLADSYIIAGSSVAFVTSSLRKKGVEARRIIALHDPEPEAVLEALMKEVGTGSVAVAMGNIVGLGDAFVERVERMSKIPLEVGK